MQQTDKNIKKELLYKPFGDFFKAIIGRMQELILEMISFKVAILVFVLIYLVKIPASNLMGLSYLKDFIAVFAVGGVGAYKFFDKRNYLRSAVPVKKLEENSFKGGLE